MPTPQNDESRSDFLDRCIPQVLDEGTADSQDQAVAICSSIWERGGKANRRTLTALADGAQLRTARFQGRKHLVAPVVMLVGNSVVRPMGSNGPELVPSAVLAESPSQWNGRPIVATHPIAGTASANSPRILEDMQFGTVFGANFTRGALRAEAWIDTQRARDLGGDALEALSRIEEGQTVEISVGAWVTLVEDPGIHNGKPFTFRWANVASDHLAVGLGGHEGACSVEMGCGVPRLNSAETGSLVTSHDQALLRAAQEAEVRSSVRSEARRPTFQGTESTRWSSPTFMDYVNALFEGDDPPSTVRDAPASLRRAIASHTLLGDPNADTFRELSFFPVVRPSTGRLNERALRSILGGRGSQANIPSSARESARSMARRLLNSEFDADLEVSFMDFSRRGLFAKVLEAFGLDINQDDDLKKRLTDLVDSSTVDTSTVEGLDVGTSSPGAVSPDVGPVDDDPNRRESTSKEERAREALRQAKTSHVDFLIESPDTPFLEDDRDALMNFSLDQLWRMARGENSGLDFRLEDSIAMMEQGDINPETDNTVDTSVDKSSNIDSVKCNCGGTCGCSHDKSTTDSDDADSTGVMAESDDATSDPIINDDSSGESGQATTDAHPTTEQEVTHMSDDTKVTRADSDGSKGSQDANDSKPESPSSASVRRELVTASKQDLIGLVISSATSPFEADDWDELASFPEDRLRSLAVHYMPDRSPRTIDEWLETAPPEFQSFYRNAMAQETGRREELIRGLNQHQDAYTVDELRALKTETLEKLAKMAGLTRAYDYSGRGLPVVRYTDDTTPPDPYEKALEARRASYSN